MDLLDYQSLCQRSAEWRRQASDMEFLGEVALTQAELEHLLRSLGRYHQRVDEPELSFALAVAAVNWAYWRGVDEEAPTGFRDAFMTHSLGSSDLRLWDRLWGPSIEGAICGWSGQRHREGAYRYVGLILRQAGVPHAKISTLAQLLKEIDHHVGWSNVPAVTDATLRTHTAALFSAGCISEHLCSESGLAYLRSLCADLQFLRCQPHRPAPDLPGYRPGFLAALLDRMQLKPGGSPLPTFQLPYIRFDIATGRLQLIFDERCVRRRTVHCDQWERRLFDSRLDVGPGGVEPTSRYTGRQEGRTWSAKGWRFTESGSWALLRADGRLETAYQHDDHVSVGDYMLVLTSRLDVRSRWPDAADDGERLLPDGAACQLWHIRVSDGDDGKLPGLQVTKNVLPWIACVNADPVTRWTPYDAVCSDAPVIEIGGWTGRNSRRFRLMQSTSAGLRGLHPQPDEDGSARIALADLPEGVPVEVTLLPVGFQHAPRASQTLRVVRFGGRISPEDRLWPATQEVALRVSVSEGLQLEGLEEVRIEGTGQDLTLVVPPNSDWAAVAAISGSARLPFRFPVRRCSFCFSDNLGEPAIFDRATIKEMCAPGAAARSFSLAAAPAAWASIIARSRDGTARLWRRGLRVGSNGRLEVPATELVDVVRNQHGVHEIIVECMGVQVPTGSLFVQPRAADLETGPWPVGVEQYLRLLRQPSATEADTDRACDIGCLRQYAAIILAVDHALQLSDVKPTSRFIPAAAAPWTMLLNRLLSEYSGVAAVGAAEWKANLLDWLNTSPLPLSPQRWALKVRALIEDLDRRMDIAGPISRLLAGQSDAAIPEGLAHGWSYYAAVEMHPEDSERLLGEAINYFGRASRGRPPWSPVAERLLALSLLRAGAITDFIAAIAKLSPTDHCRGLDEACDAIVRILALQRPQVLARDPTGLSSSSREDDRLLAAALGDEYQAWPRAGERCWLAAWLGWRLFSISESDAKQRDECRRIALLHEVNIPTRARDLVSAELRSRVVRPIRLEVNCA